MEHKRLQKEMGFNFHQQYHGQKRSSTDFQIELFQQFTHGHIKHSVYYKSKTKLQPPSKSVSL